MQPQGALSFTDLVLNASFLVQCVMLFLLALSIASWTIIISRNNQYRLGRTKADAFEDRFWSGIDLNNLYQECMKRPDDLVGLEVIYSAGFKEFVRLVNSGPADQEVVMDGTERQMRVACAREVELLESHLPTLATIGSISPYIGLFGTVWGIMHAFVALAAVKNATLAMVAPPIAEALIATAMGLFAAIPAVMFYNRFVTKVEALENRYYNFMDEFSTILNRRLVTIRTQLNRQNGYQGDIASPQQSIPGAGVAGGVNIPGAPGSGMAGQAMAGGGVPASGTINQSNVASHMGSSPDGNDLSAMNNLNALNPGNMGQTQVQQSPEDLRRSAFDSYEDNGAAVAAAAAAAASAPPVQQPVHQSRQSQDGVPSQGGRNGTMDMSSSQAADFAKAMRQNQGNGPQGQQGRQGQMRRQQGNGQGGQNMQGGGYNDNEMASNYRGVVPPRTSNAALNNAQLPGGPANATRSNSSNPLGQIRSGNSPLYKIGPEDGQPQRKGQSSEPQYITPGGQNRRRNVQGNAEGNK